MLTRRESTLAILLEITQVIISLFLFQVVGLMYASEIFSFHQSIWIQVIIIIVWSICMRKLRLGVIFRYTPPLPLFKGYLITTAIGGGAILLLSVLFFHLQHTSLAFSYILYFVFFDLVALIVFKVGCYHIMSFLRSKGYNSRTIILIVDSDSKPFINSFLKSKDWGYRIVGILTADKALRKHYKKIHIANDTEEVNRFITNHPIDDVFYCLPKHNQTFNLQKLLTDCDEIGVSIHLLQDQYHTDQCQQKATRLDRMFISHKTVSDNYICIKLKELSDFALSLLAILLSSPIMLAIALCIKLEDGGPVLFRQMRIGQNGRRFYCLKFRSMVMNAEELKAKLMAQNEADGPAFKISNDPRITKVGRIIRKLSIDELPQFFNVLRGEMSIVGPRPPLKSEVLQYSRYQLRRLSMKPGITGSWQVWGRHTVTFEEWMQMDLEYIDNWSILLDMKIMIATVGVMLKATGR